MQQTAGGQARGANRPTPQHCVELKHLPLRFCLFIGLRLSIFYFISFLFLSFFFSSLSFLSLPFPFASVLEYCFYAWAKEAGRSGVPKVKATWKRCGDKTLCTVVLRLFFGDCTLVFLRLCLRTNGLVIKNPSPFAAVSVAPLTLQRERPPRHPEPPPAQNRSQGLYE